MPGDEYYTKKASGFSQETNDALISPLFYQPTPKGVALLCAHYSAKYNLDLRCIDFRGKIEAADNSLLFFKYLAETKYLDCLSNNQKMGLVLTHGSYHAIPLLVIKIQDALHMIVFDSTSGPRIKGYFSIAKLFDKAHFYLNSGSRQVDSSSCITEAICILKEALQLPDLMSLIEAKRFDDHPSLKQNPHSMFTIPKPDNFIVFKMPEQLLLTSQSSDYITEADADLSVVIRGGKTLGEYRKHFRMQVSLTQGSSVVVAGINSYLFVKSREHKKLFDAFAVRKEELITDRPVLRHVEPDVELLPKCWS